MDDQATSVFREFFRLDAQQQVQVLDKITKVLKNPFEKAASAYWVEKGTIGLRPVMLGPVGSGCPCCGKRSRL